MKNIKLTLLSLAAVIGIMTVATPVYVGASAKTEIEGGLRAVNDGSSTDLNVNIRSIVNMMLYVLGAIAVIMIIVGGIRYTTSAGDSGRIKASKDTIMYAVVGLVVALLAFAIVNFVLRAF